ncbi:hypothetical protein TNCV_1648811 [Trichonephila clavipes]|uniref:Uncharacterized protein n=1 Tax=Trichonephila clavipes TaxID=2585209 RepID=A0A8X6RSR5_TRICX|nr:hypothetical protein TNCV_1648811 [Trichonephila clavipes]
MSRFDGLSEVRPPVFKTPDKLGPHLLTHCSRDKRKSRPCTAVNRTWTCGVEARYTTTQTYSMKNKT